MHLKTQGSVCLKSIIRYSMIDKRIGWEITGSLIYIPTINPIISKIKATQMAVFLPKLTAKVFLSCKESFLMRFYIL